MSFLSTLKEHKMDQIFEEEDVCEGCATYSKSSSSILYQTDDWCNIKARKGKHICPCSTCLIKMICDELCDEIEYYINLPFDGEFE